MMFFAQNSYRVIAHDRGGHGRSTQSAGGHDLDTYVADLIELTADGHRSGLLWHA